MQKSLKIGFYVLFSLIVFLAFLFIPQKAEITVSAENSNPFIKIGDTEYISLQDAVDAAIESDAETTISIGGTIVVSDTILIQGSTEKIVKINFVANENTTIIRNSTNTNFIMFNIRDNADVSLWAQDGKELIFEGSQQSEDVKDGKKCSIFQVLNAKLYLTDLKIQNSNTQDGGAVYIPDEGTKSFLSCTNVIFENNITFNSGGSISAKSGEVIITDCKFINNATGAFGGAVRTGATTLITNCSFENCEARGYTHQSNLFYGGSVYVTAITTITNCTFTNSKVKHHLGEVAYRGNGGAIALRNGVLNINGATISGCESDFGGAIAVLGGELTVNNFEVKNNTAAQAGGGLYLKGGTVEILNGTIQNNATTLEGKAEDVEWLISDNASTYLTNNVFSASVSNTEKNSIYSASEFPVGENFALGGKAELTLAPEKTIYVKDKLTTTAPITLSASRSNGEDMVGMRVVYFASDDAVTEKVFKMSTLEHNLVLGSEAGEKFLYITTEYLVQFYQYYENGEFKNPLTAKGQNHEQRITYGNAATEPDYGTREGMVFGGWEARLMEDPTQVVNVSPSRITNNVYFVATWGVVVQVTFTADGKQVGKPLEITTGTTITQAQLEAYAIPEKTGHTPKHWAIEVDGQLVEYTNQKITGNTTLTAVYQPDILTVTLKDENNITLGTVEVEYNNKLTADDILYINEFLDFDRVGYDDDDPYWSLNGTAFNFNTAITSNITLIATYVKNQYRVDFVVEYYTSGGVYQTDYTLNASSVGYGDVVSEFPTPKTVEGFDPTKVVWDYDNSAITENTTITGRIDINVYTVNFIVDGEVIATYQKEHFQTLDSSEIPAPIPSKVGYDQRDPIWKGDLSAEIKSDINFEAEYFLNVYYVTFILPDGTKLEPREVYHGHTVDSSNVIDLAFGEIVQFNKSLDNITEDCEISVTKINLFMWIMIAVGIIILIIAIIVTVKVVKRKRMVKEARKRHRHIGPYVTGDDEF